PQRRVRRYGVHGLRGVRGPPLMSLMAEAERLAARLTGMWWPAADPEALDRAAQAYLRVAAVVDVVREQAGAAARAVTSTTAGAGAEAFAEFWRRYDRGTDGWLHDAASACRDLAHALRRYGAVVRAARRRIADEVAADGAVLAGGIALSWCTFG